MVKKTVMPTRYFFYVPLALFVVTLTVFAKDAPPQVVVWPESGTPILRFSFGKFKEIGSLAKDRVYVTDTTIQNNWDKKISQATFALYLFDKDKVRIGGGFVDISNAGPGEVIKSQTTVHASGTPVSISLVAQSLPKELGPVQPDKTISMTVNSVPQGAQLKVDGNDAGVTPKMIRLGVGKHVLEFSQEAFNPGKYPVEISSDDVSGGSVSYELGTSAHDTIEMRDGSVLNGDLLSITDMDVVLRIAGTAQHVDRNKIKRILLVERDAPSTLPPVRTNQ